MKRQIIDALQGQGLVKNAELWEIVHKTILDGECGFCMLSLLSPNKSGDSNIHICSECQGVIHETCFKKWNKKSNGCMLCRAGAKE